MLKVLVLVMVFVVNCKYYHDMDYTEQYVSEFQMFDTNGDYQLDFKEMAEVYGGSEENPPEFVVNFFGDMDKDSDQIISQAEYVQHQIHLNRHSEQEQEEEQVPEEHGLPEIDPYQMYREYVGIMDGHDDF